MKKKSKDKLTPIIKIPILLILLFINIRLFLISFIENDYFGWILLASINIVTLFLLSKITRNNSREINLTSGHTKFHITKVNLIIIYFVSMLLNNIIHEIRTSTIIHLTIQKQNGEISRESFIEQSKENDKKEMVGNIIGLPEYIGDKTVLFMTYHITKYLVQDTNSPILVMFKKKLNNSYNSKLQFYKYKKIINENKYNPEVMSRYTTFSLLFVKKVLFIDA